MDKRGRLAYIRAQTSKKDKPTPPSSPDVGTIGHHTAAGKLRALTKDMSKEDRTLNTLYIVALTPTGSCLQDISEESAENLMQVEARQSEDITQSYNHISIM